MSIDVTNTTAAPVELYFYDELWFWMVITFAVTVVIQMTGFAIAASCKFDTITDILGSTNFVVIAVISFFGGPITWPKIVWNAIFCCSRLELGILLLVRVCKRKEDNRFDDIRGSCIKFFIFWTIQIIWAWGTSLPIIYINWAEGRPGLPASEVARLSTMPIQSGPNLTDPLAIVSYVFMVLMLLSFILQMCADVDKYFFVAQRSNKLEFCNRGLWSVSRHPNYFFEISIWWCLFLGSMPLWPIYPWGMLCVISPLWTMFLLLALSGIPFTEGKLLKRYYDDPVYGSKYHTYHQTTPPVIPCCPSVYGKCPKACKCLFCCECPCYQYEGAHDERVVPVEVAPKVDS